MAALATRAVPCLQSSFLDGGGCTHGACVGPRAGLWSTAAAGPWASKPSVLEVIPNPDTTGRSLDGRNMEVTDLGLAAMASEGKGSGWRGGWSPQLE